MNRFLSTIFFIGLLPRYQALAASLAGFLLFSLPFPLIFKIWLYAGSSLCFIISTYFYSKHLEFKDDKTIVADEFVAASLVPLFISDVLSALVCLFLFRLFDLLKIWPLNRINRINHWSMIFIDDYLAVLVSIGIVSIFNLYRS